MPVKSGRHPARSAVRVLLLAVVVVEIVLAWPVLARTAGAVRLARPGWVVVAVVAELASLHLFARTQRRMLGAAGRGLPIRRMVLLTFAANAVNVTLPGGSAISAGYVVTRLRSWGVAASSAAFAVLASGIASAATFAGLCLAGALLSGGGPAAALAAAASAAGLAGVALALRAAAARGTLGRLAEAVLVRVNRLGHRPAQAGVAALRRTLAELTAVHLRRRDWAAGLTFATGNWLADLACLVAAGQAVGVSSAHLPLLLLAYLAGMTASGVSVLPAGLGLIEGAMIFTLTGGGTGATQATACVLLYRAVSLLLVVGAGWVVWTSIALRRRGRRAVRPAQPTAPAARNRTIAASSYPSSASSVAPSASSAPTSPATVGVAENLGAGPGIAAPPTSTNEPRATLCGWRRDSCRVSTGATQASRGAKTSAHSSRVRAAKAAASTARQSSHCAGSYGPGVVAGSSPRVVTSSDQNCGSSGPTATHLPSAVP